MLILFTVVLTHRAGGMQTTRICLVKAKTAIAIAEAARDNLPDAARVAVILDLVVPPSCVTCADGWVRRGGRAATQADYEAPMTLEQFVQAAPGLFGDRDGADDESMFDFCGTSGGGARRLH